jgi:hypothetical protein
VDSSTLKHTTLRYTDMRTQPEKDFLWETDALAYLPIKDRHKAANVTWSVIDIIGGKHDYVIGDAISIAITLYTGYGKPKTMGGDYIRVWMREKAKHASSCAHVVDHQNGSYTATLKALWAGTPEIVASLVHPREAIRALYSIRKLTPTLRYIIGEFKNAGYTENTRCLPMSAIPGYRQVCDVTKRNYGMSWFCGKPSKYGLECTDLVALKSEQHFPDLPLTDAEKFLLFNK